MLSVSQIISMLLLNELLLVVEKNKAALSIWATEFDELNTQMQQLTEQVAALTTKQKPSEGTQRCYYCKQPGYTQHYCPVLRVNQRCFTCRTFGKKLLAGKRPGDACMGQQTSPSLLSPMNTVIVPVARAFSIVGRLVESSEILLDSGSSISL